MIVAILPTVVFAPLILLGAFIIADRLGWKMANGILDWTVVALIGQWRIGCVVNVIGGLASVACGIYFACDLSLPAHWIAAIFMVLFGLSRTWRGVVAWPVQDGPADITVRIGEPRGRL